MHGIFMLELYKYVNQKLGGDCWNRLLDKAGMGPKIYVASGDYPDQEMIDLVSAASGITGKAASSIWEEIGEFMTLDLIAVYGFMFDPDWKLLDLLENTSDVVHKMMQNRAPYADLPEFRCRREGPDELILVYESPRKMCQFAKGMIKGMAKHYNEKVLVDETSCMLTGAPHCEISVQLVK